MERMERGNSSISEEIKKDFYALVNQLLDDFKKDQSIRNFARIFIRLLKAVWIYYKKIRRPEV